MQTIHDAQEYSGQPVHPPLQSLELSRATYYTWVTRRAAGTLADRPVLP